MNPNEQPSFFAGNSSLQHIWNILATSTIVTLLAATFVLSQTQIYRATATIPAQTNGDSTELLSIQSADFLRTIIENNEINFKLHSGFEVYVVKGFGLTSTQKSDGKLTNEMKVSELQTNLHLNLAIDSNWIDIHFESPDPKLSASLANLIAHTYLTTASVLKDVSRTNIPPDKIDITESELMAFLRENPGAITALTKLNSLEVNLERLENKLTALEGSIVDKRIILRHLKNTTNLSEIDHDPVFTRHAGTAFALKERRNLAARHQQLSSRYGSHHLKIIALEEEMEESDRKVELQIDASIRSIENEIKSHKTNRKTANDKVANLEKTIIEWQNQQLRYVSLQQTLESAKRRLETPDKVNGAVPSFSAAAIPVDPIQPRVKESLFAVFVLSLIVMTGLTLIRFRLAQ